MLRKDEIVRGFEIARGGHPELTNFFKFGKNSAVGTSWTTIWEEGGLYNYISTPIQLTVSSTSALDTSNGTGARTIKLYGLDASGLEINETITLNGQTAVTTINTYSYVYRFVVITAGSTGGSQGIIRVGTGTVTSGVPATVYLKMPNGINQTHLLAFRVPSNKTAYLMSIFQSVGQGKEVELALYVRDVGTVFGQSTSMLLYQNSFEQTFEEPLVFQAGSDIELIARTTSGTASVSGSFSFILETNS